MFRNLSLRTIGIQASLDEAAKLAQAAGFEGMDIDMNEVVELARTESIEHVRSLFEKAGLRFGGWELPVRWKEEDEALFRADLDQLSILASIGRTLGCTRVSTWVLPYSEKRQFKENFEWHVARLQHVAAVLKRFDCKVGLEFVGTRTFRVNHRYEFIHTLQGILELCSSIEAENVGVLLDSWHWYTSHGTVEDLTQLTSKEVVNVHVNDAPIGIPIDQQIDTERQLPGETGVIDLMGFLGALRGVGYDGPVTPEPFTEDLRRMPVSKAIQTVGASMNQVWKAAGLG